VQAVKDGKPVKLDRDLITISKGDKQVVRVRWEGDPAGKSSAQDWPVGEVRRHHWGFRKAAFAVFSPDGRYYAATGVAGEEPLIPDTLRVWDLASGKLVMEVRGDLWVTFTPDSKWLVAPGPDKRIHVWDLATTKEVAQFGDHLTWTQPSALSADGRQILVADVAGNVRLYDVPKGKEIGRLECDAKLCTPYFCPDGKRAVTSDLGGTIRLWNLEKRQVIRQWQQSDVVDESMAFYRPLAFSRDGRRFITVGMDTVHFWDMESDKEVRSLRLAGKVFAAALSPDGSRLFYLVEQDSTVRLLDLAGNKEITTFAIPEWGARVPHGGMGISPDGRFAVAASWAGVVYLWRLPDPPEKTKK
jgi:WD40 repeat protein